MSDKPDQQDNDKTQVLSLKKHLPANAARGLAKAPVPKALSVSEHVGLMTAALDLNPIVHAAAPLIAVLAELRLPEVFCDAEKLRRKLVTQIKEFENNAKLKGVPAMNVLVARYALCAALDEAVLRLPSGEDSSWASQSLLNTFHEDAGGGEKFFAILERMNQDPGLNIDMLELLYLCLALGFEGKYRVMEGGEEQLRMIRESLYQRIQQQRRKEPVPLSEHCDKTDRQKRVILGIPFRRVFALTAIILLGMYILFAIIGFFMGNSTSKTLHELEAAVQHSPSIVQDNNQAQAANSGNISNPTQ